MNGSHKLVTLSKYLNTLTRLRLRYQTFFIKDILKIQNGGDTLHTCSSQVTIIEEVTSPLNIAATINPAP